MTYNRVSHEEGSANLPGRQGGVGRGDGNFDNWKGSHGGRRLATAFDGQGGGFAFAASESPEVVSYSAILGKLWRRKFLLVSIVVLGIGGGVAIIARMPPHYVAHALVAIGDPLGKSRVSLVANQGGGLTPLPDAGTVQTEVEVLKSPQLALEVIRDLKLENHPEFKPVAPPAGPPTAWSRVDEWLFGARTVSDPQSDGAAEVSQTVDNFLGHLRVSITNNSRMVDVAFDAPDPRLSMQIANAIVDRYVNKQLELRLQSAQRTSAWLRDKVSGLQDKVEEAERAVEQFRSQAGLFSAPDRTPLLLKQLTDVSAELANAQTARGAIDARLSQLGASVQSSGRGGPTGEIVDSPFMRTLDGQQADAEQRLAEASTSLGAKNPGLTGLRERLRNIHAAKRNEGLRVVASLEHDLKVARMKERDLSDRVGRLQNDIADMNRAEIKLRALEREAQADRLVLNNFISRFKETSQEGDISAQRPDAQIVSYAQLPVTPDRPKRGLLILIAGMASLIGGAVVVLLVEKADRRLHSLEDIEARLKIAGLGMLPFSRAAQLSASEAARYGSSYREAAKAIYARLFCARVAPKVMVVTSALPGEGKTTLALTLAAMAAQSSRRVVLVDADFWKGGAAAALGLRSSAGLAELLEGKAKLTDAIVSDVASGADIILPGAFSRASLLAWAGKLPELLKSLKNQYDVVIIDAPPILALSEASLLAGHADATVMAIRWASTPSDAVNAALKQLRNAGAAVAGAVIAMVRESRDAKYAYTEAAYFSKSLVSYRSANGVASRPAELQHSGKRLGLPDYSNRSPSPRSTQKGSSRYALLVLDIRDAVTGSPKRYSPSPAACDRLIGTINGLSQVASKHGVTVLYAHRESASTAIVPFSRFPEIKSNDKRSMKSPAGKHLKMVSKYTFTKRGGDAFSNAELDDFLRKEGISHLFLVGVDSAMSIKQTAHSALDLGYRVTFIQDGIFTAYVTRWERVLKDFESAAAFAIKSEEFAEFAAAVHQANAAPQQPHKGVSTAPSSTAATSAGESLSPS